MKQRRGLDVNLYEAPARDFFSTGVMGMVLAGEGMQAKTFLNVIKGEVLAHSPL